MRNFHIHTIFLIILLASWGCVEKYEPDVMDASGNFLVVEGTLVNDTTTLFLSRTSALDSLGVRPESGAQLWVENSNASYQVAFEEKESGTYRAFLNLSPADTYRLQIMSSGKVYFSEYISVKDAPEIESVDWDVSGNTTIDVNVSTHDPQNNTLYYRWEYTETWEYRSAYNSVFKFEKDEVQVRDIPGELINTCYRSAASSDIYIASSVKLTEDRISRFPLLKIDLPDDNRLDRRYSILVRQYALSREAFEFWDILKKNTESLGTLFDPQPSQLPSNLYCETDPDEPVIGYISAGKFTEKRLFIDRAEIPFSFNYNRYPTCELDTIPIDSAIAFARFNGTSSIPVDTYGLFEPTDYLYSSSSCVDCRVQGGTLEKPDFW